MVTTLAQRMKLLIPAGVTQDKFAADAGVPIPTFKRWLSGGSPPKLDAIIRIKESTGCDLNWLITGKGTPGLGGGADLQLVRRFDVNASAGNGTLVEQELQARPIAFRKDWLQRHIGVPARHLSVIVARGDSMEPTIRDGSLVLVNHLVERIENDGIYAFSIDDTLYIKRIQKLPDGRLQVKSDNDFYDDLYIENPPDDNFRIIGQIKWAANTY